MTKTCFIVTSYIKNYNYQLFILIKCIQSIHTHHPEADIVVLNDNYTIDLLKVLTQYQELADIPFQVEKTPHERCGEVNAYVWACQHDTDYSKFVFVHDSTMVLSPLPLESCTRPFTPLWFAGKGCCSTGLRNPFSTHVFQAMRIHGQPCAKEYDIFMKNGYFVTFGCMGIWTPEFTAFLKTQTNFLDIAHLFNERGKRCLFERLATIYANVCTPVQDYSKLAVCGLIFAHKQAFRNRVHDSTLANNPYMLKIWQGR